MKNLFKKNQVMITALAIMIAIAGYLQFAGTNLEEDYLTVNDGDGVNMVSSGGVITDNYTAEDVQKTSTTEGILGLSDEELLLDGVTEITSMDSDLDVIVDNYLADGMTIQDNTGVTQSASVTPEAGKVPGEAVFTATTGVEVLSDAKLSKEQTRAKNKETLLSIINSDGLGDAQKQEAVNHMVQMTAIAEKETAAEILLEAKGFSDVVVSIHDNKADVVVNALELSEAQRAQIEDIVRRKTEVPAENIIISTIVQ